MPVLITRKTNRINYQVYSVELKNEQETRQCVNPLSTFFIGGS